MFSDHDGLKLEINKRKITGKSPNTWNLNKTLLNKMWIKRKSQEGK